jgi:hypothetical protein
MIVDAPWYVPITVIRRDLQIPTVKEEIHLQISVQCAPQCTSERPSSEPHGAIRQQAIAKKLAKRSAYQIRCLILVFRV